MNRKIGISMAVVSLLLMGIMATSVFASDLRLATNTDVSKELLATAKSETPERLVTIREISPTKVISDEVNKLREIDDVEKLEEMVPKTYEETDAHLPPRRTRFLLYTHDGKHIMWGFVGNGYFVGKDNLGKRCWGIYGKSVFAGLYDGIFFWGRYRSGYWKAVGLFEEKYSHGRYILFPTVVLEAAITANVP